MARPKPNDETLTRERVCKEALALVDEEGLEALSMRRLGARLGFEAMSLYRHVRDKADLLDALHAAVLGELEPVEACPHDAWRGPLRRRAPPLPPASPGSAPARVPTARRDGNEPLRLLRTEPRARGRSVQGTLDGPGARRGRV